MIAITCTEPTIGLRLPPCAAVVASAHLTRHPVTSYPLTITGQDTVLEDGSRQLVLSDIPEDAKRGVYRLVLETDCGCFDTAVFLDICRTPAMQGVHDATQQPGSIECCEGEEE